MEYTLSSLARGAEEAHVSLGEYVLALQSEDMGVSPDEIIERMDRNLSVMEGSRRQGLTEGLRSHSGLTGGDALRLERSGGRLCGDFCREAMVTALAIAECNAAMGRIVASPTAGSCGILPAAVLTCMEQKNVSRREACLALIAAGGIGLVIAVKAGISGAAGGCQAECGSAAAMAAAALTELMGGTPDDAIHACAIAIKNQLGLICDPVAGLVEVPCIKRNAGGVMCAIMAAELALAGVRSVIPPDEVLTAMREAGDKMPCEFRETAKGGLANTPTGRKIAEEKLK